MDLRPLSIGELLDRTFSYYRKHFWLFVGIVAAPQVLMVLVSLLVQSLRLTGTPQAPAKDPMEVFAQFPGMIAGFFVAMLLLILAATVVYSLVQGAVAYALAEVHMGRSINIAGAFRSLRGKVWRLLDTVFSIGVRVVGIYFLFILGLVIIVAIPVGLMQGLGQPNPILVIIVGILALLGLLAVSILAPVIVMRYSLSIPALMLENLGARQAIKRSVTLAKGNIWKIFLIFLLMYLISMVVISIFQALFMVASVVIAARHGLPPLWLQILSTISGGIGGTLSTPLVAIALTLLYFDARVRKEGFDLQLMMANLGVESASAEPPPISSPPAPSESL